MSFTTETTPQSPSKVEAVEQTTTESPEVPLNEAVLIGVSFVSAFYWQIIPLQVACGHQFVTVAYSNYDSFYLGWVLNKENGTCSISFLVGGDEEYAIYSWPSQMVVEQVASHQVFMDGLKSEEMDSNKLVFPQLKEIAAWFVPFKESLVKREKI